MRSVLGSLGLALLLSVGACSNETRVSEIEPQQGTFTGGEEIMIKGKNFPVAKGGVSVQFGRKAATNVVIENSSMIKVSSSWPSRASSAAKRPTTWSTRRSASRTRGASGVA